MKTKFALCVAVAALGSALSPAVEAGPARMHVAQMIDIDVLPPYEINTIVRSMGLDPITRPQRRGRFYILNAIDPRGIEMRVVTDARVGAVVSVMPAVPMHHDAGPRIIHVPPASLSALPDDPDDGDMAPEASIPRQEHDPRQYDRLRDDKHRVTAPARAPAVKSASTPPATGAPPRAVPPSPSSIATPPPRAAPGSSDSTSDGPTPIRPLPKLGNNERFSSPEPKTTGSVPAPVPQQAASGPGETAKPSVPVDKSIEMLPVAPLDE